MTLLDDEVLAEIKQQLALLRYGSLEISVHNGQVVQLERREKNAGKKRPRLIPPVNYQKPTLTGPPEVICLYLYLEFCMSFRTHGAVKHSGRFTLKLISISVLALSAQQAAAGFPTLYGKVFLTANSYDLEKIILPSPLLRPLPINTRALPALPLN